MGEYEAMTLLKFPTANHRLPIETGRYESIPFENRICTLCSSNQVGTEEHYPLHCNYFQEDRTAYLHINSSDIAPHVSAKTFLASADTTTLKNVSKFVSVVMNHFRN